MAQVTYFRSVVMDERLAHADNKLAGWHRVDVLTRRPYT